MTESVAKTARALGSPPGHAMVEDSGYITAERVQDLLAAARLREAVVLTAGKMLIDSWPRQNDSQRR